MGTRLDINELREYLIDLYKRFLSGEDIRVEARKTFGDYRGSYRFTSEDITESISYLEDIGWDIPPKVSHIEELPKDHVLKILKSLKKEEANPPKEWFRDVYQKKK